MKQPIIGWHQDEHGDWVAELTCGHVQHVRHAPPLSERPWVLTPEGRARFLRFELNCVRCDEDMALAGENGLNELTTERLLIRQFVSADTPEIRRILNAAFASDDSLEDMASWLSWSALGARWFPAMRQPPYGDRAVVLKASGALIGSVGYVPLLMPFDQIPALARAPGPAEAGQMTPEVGLFWAIDPAQHRRGYASEAAAALIEYAFQKLRLWRILATTQYENVASQTVMRKVGMTLTHNPHAEPEWMQVVGFRYAHRPARPPAVQEGLLT